MSRPRRYLVRMIVFLVVAVIAAGVIYSPLAAVFGANPLLNGLILGVLGVGILYIFRQIIVLYPEVAWIEAFRTEQPGLSMRSRPKLLGPMAQMFGERKGRLSLSALSTRSILDSISARLDESRDISRYMIGLLIFLGLLGTFWGLLGTIRAVAQVIGQLDVTGPDMATVFGDLKRGLEAPLAGMGTAFSSSLFGLAGSLILGFLDLQASQAQNRFYNDLEEWLASATRLSSGGAAIVEGGEQSVPAYLQALLETTADSLDNLQRTISRSESERAVGVQGMASLAERLSTLTDQMRSEQDLMVQLAQNQLEMRPILAKLSESSSALDEASRNHIRNVDVHLVRLLDESATGRTQMVQEIRSEIRLLARTIAALAEDSDAEERR